MGLPAGLAQAPPAVVIVPGARHGHATPERHGCTHTGGGNVDVAQPAPDTLVVTLTGVAVAYPSPKASAAVLRCDLDQCFEIATDNPKVKKAKLTVEARVIGLLRSHAKIGTAAYDDACATVAVGPVAVLTLCVPPHAVAAGDNLSVNDHDGPVTVPVTLGQYTLRQTFTVRAASPRCLWPCKAPSAEFAPDPALDPLWISAAEPFHGAGKKDFGFQVILKVAEDAAAKAEGK